MKNRLFLLALIFAFTFCEKNGPEYKDGFFYATIPASVGDSPQAVWSAGDRIVLTNCKEPLYFNDGEPVLSSNSECITVSSEMISNDGLSVSFEPQISKTGKYVIVTGRDFSGIESIGKDGKVDRSEREVQTTLNYIGLAESSDGRFNLTGLDNIFTISILDKRIKYFDVSAGYSSYELTVDSVPVRFYIPLPSDEDLSDGIYAYAYDESCDQLFSEHFENPDFRPFQVLDFGEFFDTKGADANILKEILKENATVEQTYNLEGEILKRYLDEVQYDDDYSYTKIKNYVTDGNEAATLRPAYISISGLKNATKIYLVSEDYDIHTIKVSSSDRQAVYNLIPGRTYRYGIVSVDSATGRESLLKKGCIATEGRVRYIKTTKYMHNVRDIGGWEGLDGKHIKYGMLIRGSEIMNRDKNLTKYEQADYDALVGQVGIEFDLDLRNEDEVGNFKKSPFGLEFLRIPLSAYDSIVKKKDRQPAFKKAFLKILSNAREGKCTYLHCQGGADRTGTLVFYIEGLLGVSDSDLCKDYEITSFYYHKERNDPERYLPMIRALQSKYSDAGSIGEAIHRSANDMGITDANIQELRSLFLE